MAWVWEQGPEDPGERFVLLKLADNANNDGSCYPSMTEICRATRLSESSVRRSLKALMEGGWVTVSKGLGRGNTSLYQLHKKVSAGHLLEEIKGVRETLKGVTQTEKGVRLTEPPHPLKGVTTKNHQEPPDNFALVPPSTHSELPEWVNADAWAGFVEMRKKIKAPLTGRAIQGIVADLSKLKAQGQDPNACLDLSTQRCWRGVFAVKLSPETVLAMPKPKTQYELDAEAQREERRLAVDARKAAIQ
jgi:DNA-binding transcriptional ArsR family regulator